MRRIRSRVVFNMDVEFGRQFMDTKKSLLMVGHKLFSKQERLFY